ncbi:regulator of G-protein signaling 20 isoform X1 [Strongylocentrotus purpuratus]|uniref:RGS domain-containing protein n=2 Tax=Strongylocentrotus purpuratus TaxID=7668 RepID=A0A7M7REJ4_STRPU|nr:regulator of G-protein signaling 20 isoform X1 [Strongylocentrotus purpuratus]|eukprot:XP_794623.4 PREDICTED: regulator of G-protein signaling 20 isoform X1 [Strongylocentrotus purpuratus]
MSAVEGSRWSYSSWPLARRYKLLVVEMRERERGRERSPQPSPGSQSQNDRSKGSKACCFCWCCCCSCSCLTMRNNSSDSNGKKDTPLDIVNGDSNEMPTLDEIRLWHQSFDTLMSSGKGRRKFREFLRSEYSEENLLFWLACEELHKETNSASVEEKARLIYEDYISILSPKEVSLDSSTREIVNNNMVDPTIHAFDEAQKQIYILMLRDSFPRFLNSKMFRNLMETVSRREP